MNGYGPITALHVFIMKKLLLFIPILLSIFTVLPASATSVTPLCSYTFDSSNHINGSTQYCENFLSAIKYVEIDFGVDSSVNQMSVQYNTNQYNNTSKRTYYLVAFDNPPYSYIQTGSGFSDTYPLTISFYSEQPGPQPEPCPEPEPQDPNRSPVMDDFHNVFINTMLSVIPITAIIFVVWFFIDMLSSLVFGRGK